VQHTKFSTESMNSRKRSGLYLPFYITSCLDSFFSVLQSH
jgi:hypothetical protein